MRANDEECELASCAEQGLGAWRKQEPSSKAGKDPPPKASTSPRNPLSERLSQPRLTRLGATVN